MKRRRGRRSFWWWSWLLLVTAIGGTLGGAIFGKQQWEKADKDYPSTAIVKVGIRAPFKGRKYEQAPTGVANVNESEVMRKVKSHEGLSPVATKLDLMQKWGLGLEEVTTILRSSLDLELNQEDKELNVTVIRPDPAEASELANAIAETIPDVVKKLNEDNKTKGLERLKSEGEPFLQEEEDARLFLKKALENIKVKLDPKPGIDLNVYLYDPAVLSAKVAWDSAREARVEFIVGQKEFEQYWTKTMKPSLLTTKATPAPNFTGPEMQPFQVQFGLYGLTLGLFGGLLLMAICWKLFP